MTSISTNSTSITNNLNENEICLDEILTDILRLAIDEHDDYCDWRMAKFASWRLVSKQFNRVACQPTFWRTIVWHEWRKGSMKLWLQSLATNSHIVDGLVEFQFVGEYSVPGYMPPLSDDDLQFVLERFPHVRKLMLLQCGDITDAGADILIANRARLEALTFQDNWALSQAKIDELRAAFADDKRFQISVQGS